MRWEILSTAKGVLRDCLGTPDAVKCSTLLHLLQEHNHIQGEVIRARQLSTTTTLTVSKVYDESGLYYVSFLGNDIFTYNEGELEELQCL